MPECRDQRSSGVKPGTTFEALLPVLGDRPGRPDQHRVLHAATQRRPGIGGELHAEGLREPSETQPAPGLVQQEEVGLDVADQP